MSETKNLMVLAKANLAKSDDQVALERLQDSVEAAGARASQELYDAKIAAKQANKDYHAMLANPGVTLKAIISAERASKLAQATYEEMKSLASERFGSSED